MKRTINEEQLRKIVKESITNILKEGFLDKMYMAHVPSNKEIPNPQVTDVIERDGWKIINQQQQQGGTVFQIEQKTGAFANTEGTLNLDELVADIKEFGKIAKILKREPVYNSMYSKAEKAVIFVK